MATLKSDLVAKKIRHRGLYSGKSQTVAGSIKVAAGGSIALADLIQAVPLGENVRPGRLRLYVTPLSGTPVLTNPTFNVGVTTITAANFTRPNGDVFVPVTTSATVLSTGLVVAANTITDVEVPRPVADSVSKYAPFYVTLTPAGVGAFSVAGGDILLTLEVEFAGEINPATAVYSEFNSQKVAGV